MRNIHRLNDRSTRNMTSLNDRFADLFVHSISIGPPSFTINQVALGFINAVKVQAIENCNQRMSTYTFTDTEYEDDPIRIEINAAAGSPVRHRSKLPLPVRGYFLNPKTCCRGKLPILAFYDPFKFPGLSCYSSSFTGGIADSRCASKGSSFVATCCMRSRHSPSS